MIEFFVPGIPRPGGSKTATVIRRKGGAIVMTQQGRPLITMRDDAKGNKEWRGVVAHFARRIYSEPPLRVALSVRWDFIVTRPKGHYGSGKNAARVKDSAPPFPTTKPDTTKLIRAAEDALTGILWVDDSQIVRQTATKSYGDTPGMRIVVNQLEIAPPRPPETKGLFP